MCHGRKTLTRSEPFNGLCESVHVHATKPGRYRVRLIQPIAALLEVHLKSISLEFGIVKFANVGDRSGKADDSYVICIVLAYACVFYKDVRQVYTCSVQTFELFDNIVTVQRVDKSNQCHLTASRS